MASINPDSPVAIADVGDGAEVDIEAPPPVMDAPPQNTKKNGDEEEGGEGGEGGEEDNELEFTEWDEDKVYENPEDHPFYNPMPTDVKSPDGVCYPVHQNPPHWWAQNPKKYVPDPNVVEIMTSGYCESSDHTLPPPHQTMIGKVKGMVNSILIDDDNAGTNYNEGPEPIVVIGPPDLPGGVQAEATATYNRDTGSITGCQVHVHGSGYLNPPPVVIEGGNNDCKAKAIWIMSRTKTGFVDTITLGKKGEGFSKEDWPIVTIGQPDGPDKTQHMQAEAFARFNEDTGRITSINISNRGNGYNTSPPIIITGGNGEASAVCQWKERKPASGVIEKIYIVNGGSGFINEKKIKTAEMADEEMRELNRGDRNTNKKWPKVHISPPDASGGTQALAEAEVDEETGAIVKINVTNRGSGYTEGSLISSWVEGGNNDALVRVQWREKVPLPSHRAWDSSPYYYNPPKQSCKQKYCLGYPACQIWFCTIFWGIWLLAVFA